MQTTACQRHVAFGQHSLEKLRPAVCAIPRSYLDPNNQAVACLAVQHGSGGAFGGDGIMNPRRSATVAALCGTIVLAGWIVGLLAGSGSARIEKTGVAPIEDRAASVTAHPSRAE